MSRSKKTHPKARRPTHIKPKKFSWFKATIFLLIALIIAGAFFYFLVDKRVVSVLASRSTGKASSVLSAPLSITRIEGASLLATKQYLNDRNYREVVNLPNTPGEFAVRDKEVLIFIREFEGIDTKLVPAKKITFDTESYIIKQGFSSGESLDAFQLEPKIISNLGMGEQRVSNYKSLNQIPEVMRQAVIAIEDERFFEHHGVDPVAILRAFTTNLMALQLVQGGSTLTQQLAKNMILTPERSIKRKFSEFFAAFSLEFHLSKEEILELYLNEIYLGQEGSFALHGVPEACKAFFGKDIGEINLGEAALLAGIIKAPSSYAPRKHLARAIERKDLVLQKMQQLGYISDDQLRRAKLEKTIIVQENRNKRGAPYFVAALQQELSSVINTDAISNAGVRVFTGLSYEMQECAEKILPLEIEEIEKKYPKLKRGENRIEGGLLAIEPHSGLIKAWNGGRDFSENQFNHVSQALRQIGSTMKPFLYLTALDGTLNSYKVATVTSVLSDKPLRIEQINQKSWQPENYDKRFRGDVTLRYALENSLNLPAVYVGQRVGPEAVARTANLFRVGDKIEAIPALALGAADTTLLKLTAAYAALANGGRYVAPRLYVSAIDNNNEILSQSIIDEEKVADENAVYILTDILKGVIARGTAQAVRSLGYKRAAAGKTGTSNEARDAWFVGFTPNLTVGVWVGFDDNSKLGLTGASLAVPIWTKFMQCIEKFHENVDFIQPRGVIMSEIDSNSLEMATAECPTEYRVRELYVKGTEPNRACHLHNHTPIDETPSMNDLPPDENENKRRKKSFWEDIFE